MEILNYVYMEKLKYVNKEKLNSCGNGHSI